MESKARSDYFPTRMIYETACQFWDDNNWPRIPLESLPENAIGSYFEDEGDILAFAFIYDTNSNISWFEWMTCSITCRKQKRSEIIASTIEFAENYARQNGKILFTSVRNVNLISRLESRNWKQTDSGMTNFIFS